MGENMFRSVRCKLRGHRFDFSIVEDSVDLCCKVCKVSIFSKDITPSTRDIVKLGVAISGVLFNILKRTMGNVEYAP